MKVFLKGVQEFNVSIDISTMGLKSDRRLSQSAGYSYEMTEDSLRQAVHSMLDKMLTQVIRSWDDEGQEE